MRRGIRGWVVAVSRDAGEGVRRLTPSGVAAFLVASAIAPIAQPLLDPKASGLATALAGQVGAVGANYLTELLVRVVDRLRDGRAGSVPVSEEELRDALAERVTQRLDEGDERLAGEIAAVLSMIDGVQVALEAAVEVSAAEVQQVLVDGFTGLESSFEQFAGMQRDTHQVLLSLQREQMRQGIEQRAQTNMLHRSMTMTILLARQVTAWMSRPAEERPETATAAMSAQIAGSADSGVTGRDWTTDGCEVCPYRGLAAFQPEDAAWFFGREALTAELVARLAERLAGPSLLVVVGASGSGKSSLLRAGLLPALSEGALQVPGSDSWPWLLLTPGPQPLSELAVQTARLAGVSAGSVLDDLKADPARLALVVRQAHAEAGPTVAWDDEAVQGGVPLARLLNQTSHDLAGSRLLVVVDQFEELFDPNLDEAERRGYIRALCAAASSGPAGGEEPPALVILGIRADFYPQCTRYPELRDLLQDGQVVVGPMSPTAVRQAIEAPAARAGLRLQPGFVELLLRDADVTATTEDDERGGLAVGMLPLLSHVLLETWQRREDDTLTLDGYLAAGGIREAVATTAEACYQAFQPAEQAIARWVLLRMVTVGEGIEPTRRRVDRAELLDDRPAEQATMIAAVLDRLAAARLVTLDRDTVEITHEALLHAWPRLRDWLREDRDGLRIHRQLTDAARIWVDLERDPSALYQGTRLAAAIELTADPGRADLAPLEQAFLDASVARQASEQRAVRRRNRLLLQLSGGLAALLAVAVVASGVALQQRDQARQQRNQVRQQHQIGVSHALVERSVALYPRDPSTALLLGAAAFRIAPTFEARSHLLSLTGRDHLISVLKGHRGDVYDVAFSPDGRLLASAGLDKSVRMWDMRRRAHLATLTGRRGLVFDVAFSPDGRTLAAASNRVQLWDVQRRVLLATLPGHATHAVAFSPDGRTLAAAIFGAVQLWDVRRRALLATLPGASGGGVAFSPDGRTLAVATTDRGVQLWDVGRRVPSATLISQTQLIYEVAFSPDGRTLAAGTPNRGVQLWDLRRRVLLTTIPSRDRSTSEVAFGPNGQLLAIATAGSENEVDLWSVDGGRRLVTLTGDIGSVQGMTFSPDGQMLAAAGADGGVGLWDVGRTLYGAFSGLAVSPDGRTLATGDPIEPTLWDVRRRARLATLRPYPLSKSAIQSDQQVGPGSAAVFSPDGRTLAAGTPDGVGLWDVRGRVPLAPLRVRTGQAIEISGAAFSPDGRTLAATTHDDNVQLWDVRRRTLLATLTGHTHTTRINPARSTIRWVTFSPDGRLIATRAVGEIRIWDVRQRTLVTELPGPARDATTPLFPLPTMEGAFSRDGRILAVASDNNTVRLWDVNRHAALATLTGHTDDILSVAFSPDGHTLASSSIDGTMRLWDADRHTPLATLTGHSDDVLSVAFSPDGHTLVSSSIDGTMRQWEGSTSHALTRICGLVGHDLTPQEWSSYVPDWPYQHTCS